MRFTIPPSPAERAKLDLLVLARSPAQCKQRARGLYADLDRSLKGLLHKVARSKGFVGKPDQRLLLHTHHRLPAAQIALLGVGDDARHNLESTRRFAARALRLAEGARATRVGLVLPPAGIAIDPTAAVEAAVEGATLSRYRFDRYLREERHTAEPQVRLFAESGLDRATRAGLSRGEATARAVALARDLVNEPASTLTPTQLARIARDVARERGLQIKILGPREIARQELRLIEAVAAGSSQPPQLVKLSYRGPGKPRCSIALVGKGVTFDAGGLDIKTAAGMLEMKIDMAGAATVLGTMAALAEHQVPVKVTGYLACTENLLGGSAFKPGDIIRSRAGLSVEIGNTDAEGRLVLADALTLAGEDQADVVIDVATLTGACMIALGSITAGLFSDDDQLAELLRAAGADAGEDWWRLPLTEALKEQLKSPIADLKNVGARYGGAITAALFLREFAPPGARWAHLDIAGPARASSDQDYERKGGTGFGVRTLVRAIERLALET